MSARTDLLVIESWLTSALEQARQIRVTLRTETAEQTAERMSELKTDVEIALSRIGKLDSKLAGALEPLEPIEQDYGSACGKSCGYCGMCSAW